MQLTQEGLSIAGHTMFMLDTDQRLLRPQMEHVQL